MTEKSYPIASIDPPTALPVLCIDLDGTLVRTDTLVESILGLVKREPRYLFWILLWVLKGRAYLKQRVAENCNLNPAELPYCRELISWIKVQREMGTRIALATGADERIAT